MIYMLYNNPQNVTHDAYLGLTSDALDRSSSWKFYPKVILPRALQGPNSNSVLLNEHLTYIHVTYDLFTLFFYLLTSNIFRLGGPITINVFYRGAQWNKNKNCTHMMHDWPWSRDYLGASRWGHWLKWYIKKHYKRVSPRFLLFPSMANLSRDRLRWHWKAKEGK